MIMKKNSAMGRYLLLILLGMVLGLGIGGGLFFLVSPDPQPDPVATPAEKPQPAADGPRLITLVAPQTGPLAEMGGSMVRGAALAVDEANAAGGLRPFELYVIDEIPPARDDASPRNADRAPTVIGHALERSLQQSMEAYARDNQVVVLPVIASPEAPLLAPGRIFRIMPSETDQASALARFAAGTLGLKRVLIVMADNAWGQSMADAFAETRTEPPITAEEIPLPGPDGIPDLASRIAAAAPDAVFLALHTREAIILTEALAQTDAKPVLLGTHAIARPETLGVLERLSPEAHVALPVDFASLTDEGKQFMTRYEEQNRRVADWVAAMTYDATRLAIQARDQAGEKPEDIARRLSEFNGADQAFAGLAGPSWFQPEGQGVWPVNVVRVSPDLMGRAP